MKDTDDVGALRARITELETICAEAYVCVGSLLIDLGQVDSPHAEKLLDNLSDAALQHTDVLPWPSFAASEKGAR